MVLATVVVAYDNSSMTDAYRLLVHQKPLQAVGEAGESQMGDFFYLLLFMGGYIGIWGQTKNLNLPTAWALTLLASYRYLLTEISPWVFYLLTVFTLFGVLMKLISPWYRA